MSKQMIQRNKMLVLLGGILALALLAVVLWPAPKEALITLPLRQAATKELEPLESAVSTLVQGEGPTRKRDCYDDGHTLIETHLFCRDMFVYKASNEPLPDASRADVINKAKLLDEVLTQNGWKPDRPQDAIHTVADAVPTAAREAFHSEQVPFYKNIGEGVSCNLVVQFSGPTSGTSPGIISIPRFSCQKHFSYFQPHFSVGGGIGG